MPLYEYKCINCEKIHEVMQKFSDPRLEKCPDCQGAVEKLLSMSSFSLKGTGWYTTDYKAKPKAAASPKAAPMTEGSKAAESKPAAATAAPTAPAPAPAKSS